MCHNVANVRMYTIQLGFFSTRSGVVIFAQNIHNIIARLHHELRHGDKQENPYVRHEFQVCICNIYPCSRN